MPMVAVAFAGSGTRVRRGTPSGGAKPKPLVVSAVYDASAWTNASLWRGALPAEVDQLSSRITLGGDAVERESYRALRYLETPESDGTVPVS